MANKKIKDLTNDLNNEKTKNIKLNNDLKIEIDKQKKIHTNANIKIKELEKLIEIRNNELNDLKSKLNNDHSISSIRPGEKIIAVTFLSPSYDIQIPMACKNTDIIARLEEKVYNEYPKYKDYNTYLTVNGNVIKRFKSLDENGIKNYNSIIVNIYDE